MTYLLTCTFFNTQFLDKGIVMEILVVFYVACLFKINYLFKSLIYKISDFRDKCRLYIVEPQRVNLSRRDTTLNFVEAAYDPFNTQVHRAPCMSETTRWAPTALSLAISEIAFGVAYVSHIPSLQGGLRDVCRRFSVSHPLSAFSPFHSVRLLSNI